MFDQLKKHLEQIVDISDQDIEVLKGFFHPKYLKKKEFLFRQNEICEQSAYVVKGCLRNYHINKEGEEQIVNFAIEEWWVGDLQSFFLRAPSSFNVQAIEPCTLLAFTKTEFEEARERVPQLGEFYRKKTQVAYTNAQKSIFERAEVAEERYLKLLETSPEIVRRVPQHYLASFLGIKPQSLSRIRKKIS